MKSKTIGFRLFDFRKRNYSVTITNLDSLKLTPKNGDFFEKIDFYSSLKEKNISDKKYEDVKKLFKLLRLETLGNMNKIYNIQDTLILCEIFEQRSNQCY